MRHRHRCPERFRIPHHWRCSRPGWTGLGSPSWCLDLATGIPAHGRGVGTQPNPFCDSRTEIKKQSSISQYISFDPSQNQPALAPRYQQGLGKPRPAPSAPRAPPTPPLRLEPLRLDDLSPPSRRPPHSLTANPLLHTARRLKARLVPQPRAPFGGRAPPSLGPRRTP